MIITKPHLKSRHHKYVTISAYANIPISFLATKSKIHNQHIKIYQIMCRFYQVLSSSIQNSVSKNLFLTIHNCSSNISVDYTGKGNDLPPGSPGFSSQLFLSIGKRLFPFQLCTEIGRSRSWLNLS